MDARELSIAVRHCLVCVVARRARNPPWLWLLCAIAWLQPIFAAETSRRPFDVPAGVAPATLRVFSAQAGGSLLYSVDAVAGVTTHAVRGEFAPSEALNQMLEGTPLLGRHDVATGALSVTRRVGAENPALEPPPEASRPPPAKELVELSPFNVNSARDRGFVAASALTGGRLA